MTVILRPGCQWPLPVSPSKPPVLDLGFITGKTSKAKISRKGAKTPRKIFKAGFNSNASDRSDKGKEPGAAVTSDE